MATRKGYQDFDAGKIAKICERIALGETLTKILSEPGMPSQRAFTHWNLMSQTGKRKLLIGQVPMHEVYAEARAEQADFYADKMVDLTEVPLKGDKTDNALVQKHRLQIDTLKWIASKLKPQRYGDKVVHAGDKEAPVQVQIVDYSKA
jgi:hypothetical protein